jgi:hypothetical protein
MKTKARLILQSARIAELRDSAMEVAALCEQRAPASLPKSSSAKRRCLLQLLRLERIRNSKLVTVVEHG